MEDNLTHKDIRLTDRAFLLLVIAPIAGLLPVMELLNPAAAVAPPRAAPGNAWAYLMMVFLAIVAAPIVGYIMVLRGRPYPLFRRLGRMALVLPLSQVLGSLQVIPNLPFAVAAVLLAVVGLLFVAYMVFAVVAGTIWLVNRPRIVRLAGVR